MPISFRSGALHVDPSLRVRWHGRNRLPGLAVSLTLTTGSLFLGAAFFAPVSGNEQNLGAGPSDATVVEMRSAATGDTLIPVRRDVRIIRLDRSSTDIGTNG